MVGWWGCLIVLLRCKVDGNDFSLKMDQEGWAGVGLLSHNRRGAEIG